MKSTIKLFLLALTLGAFTFLTGCYTRLATIQEGDDEYGQSTYQQRDDQSDTTEIAQSENPPDSYDQPRYNVGFTYYYPWYSTFSWGYTYDPWYYGYYDPWYSWYFTPWRFSAYSYWYSPYYYGGFYPGYYYYYQPYVVQRGAYYAHRGSGYSRTGGVRDGYTRTGMYGGTATSLPNAGRYATSRGTSASRSSAVPQRNRSTQSGVTRGSSGASRSGATGTSRSSAPSTSRGSSRGGSRSSGATRSHEQSYSNPAPSYSPPPSGSSGSRSSGGSGSGSSSGSSSGSNRSSGSSRGHR